MSARLTDQDAPQKRYIQKGTAPCLAAEIFQQPRGPVCLAMHLWERRWAASAQKILLRRLIPVCNSRNYFPHCRPRRICDAPSAETLCGPARQAEVLRLASEQAARAAPPPRRPGRTLALSYALFLSCTPCFKTEHPDAETAAAGVPQRFGRFCSCVLCVLAPLRMGSHVGALIYGSVR